MRLLISGGGTTPLTTPGDDGKLSRYDATVIRLRAAIPNALPLGWLLDNTPLFWAMALNPRGP